MQSRWIRSPNVFQQPPSTPTHLERGIAHYGIPEAVCFSKKLNLLNLLKSRLTINNLCCVYWLAKCLWYCPSQRVANKSSHYGIRDTANNWFSSHFKTKLLQLMTFILFYKMFGSGVPPFFLIYQWFTQCY